MRNGWLLPASLGLIGSLALAACDGRRAEDVLATLPAGEIGDRPPGFSAPVMFFSSFAATMHTDPASCPTDTIEGDTRILQGGCTDEFGREWFGRAVFPSALEPTALDVGGTVQYEGFGSDEQTSCADLPEGRTRRVLDGTVVFTGTATSITFDSDLVITISGTLEDCTEGERLAAIDYAGSMTRSGETRSTWSGSGAVGTEEGGRYEIETQDEVLDSEVCSDEALSGSTTITAGEHVAVVTYDGATDCDTESTATWTLDGEDRGELTGVACSASPGRGGHATMALLGLGAAIAWRLRRRRVSAGAS